MAFPRPPVGMPGPGEPAIRPPLQSNAQPIAALHVAIAALKKAVEEEPEEGDRRQLEEALQTISAVNVKNIGEQRGMS